MFKLSRDDVHLAAEFRGNPYGHHSPALEAALDQLRVADTDGKLIAVCRQVGHDWMLARLFGNPPTVVFLEDQQFVTREDCEWAAFKLRWRALTDHELELE